MSCICIFEMSIENVWYFCYSNPIMARRLHTYKISKTNKNTQVADNWAVLEDFFKKSTAEIDASLKRVRHKYPHMFSN